jgi:hypothetical protein
MYMNVRGSQAMKKASAAHRQTQNTHTFRHTKHDESADNESNTPRHKVFRAVVRAVWPTEEDEERRSRRSRRRKEKKTEEDRRRRRRGKIKSSRESYKKRTTNKRITSLRT